MHKARPTSNWDVAEAFAEGRTSGAVKHMYIEGNAVFSYGPHFPIAVRKRGKVYFNSDGYSMSTAKHKSNVRRALEANGIKTTPKDTQKLREMI